MANKIETGRLYGVISPILPDGEFVKCKPIFIDYWAYNHPIPIMRELSTLTKSLN